MNRKAHRVLWADGRAVQYFTNKADAEAFYRDYRKLDSVPPKFVDVPKGQRIRESYSGPHPSALKYITK